MVYCDATCMKDDAGRHGEIECEMSLLTLVLHRSSLGRQVSASRAIETRPFCAEDGEDDAGIRADLSRAATTMTHYMENAYMYVRTTHLSRQESFKDIETAIAIVSKHLATHNGAVTGRLLVHVPENREWLLIQVTADRKAKAAGDPAGEIFFNPKQSMFIPYRVENSEMMRLRINRPELDICIGNLENMIKFIASRAECTDGSPAKEPASSPSAASSSLPPPAQ